MQTIDLKITPNKECNDDNHTIRNVTKGMICAGGQEEDKGPCHGDSGGPLQCKIGEEWVQVGITSWTKPCAHLNHPTVYTRVGEYADWIAKHIAE
jgi:secreted trypsin-like serine protease